MIFIRGHLRVESIRIYPNLSSRHKTQRGFISGEERNRRKVHRAAAPAEVSGRAGFEYKFLVRSLLGVTMSPLCSFYIRGRFVIPTGAAFFWRRRGGINAKRFCPKLPRLSPHERSAVVSFERPRIRSAGLRMTEKTQQVIMKTVPELLDSLVRGKLQTGSTLELL